MTKFKFVNGVMVKDDGVPTASIAVVSTPEELMSIQTAKDAGVPYTVAIPENTQRAIEEFSSDDFVKKFKLNENLNEGEILDRLFSICSI